MDDERLDRLMESWTDILRGDFTVNWMTPITMSEAEQGAGRIRGPGYLAEGGLGHSRKAIWWLHRISAGT